MKKLLAIALSVLMLVSVLPLAVFAEVLDTDTCKIVDANGNDVEGYATLAEAWAAVKDGEKIVVMSDVTVSSNLLITSYDPNNVKDVTIEGAAKTGGGKYKISAGTLIYGVGLINLTLKNLEIAGTSASAGGLLKWDPVLNGATWVNNHVGSTTLIEDCILSAECMVLKMKGGSTNDKKATYNLTIKNSTVTGNSGDALLLANSGACVDIDIINSTLTHTKGMNNVDINDNMFVLSAGNDNSVYDISLDGTSKLVSALTNTDVYASIFGHVKGVANVTLAQGAELYMNSPAHKTSNRFVGSGTVNFTDNGAIWKANANTVKNGITLPSIYDGNGTEHSWFVGENIISNLYTDANASADVVFTHKVYDDPANNPNNVVYITKNNQTTYYTSLTAAIAAAASGDTIKLMRDLTHTTYATPAFAAKDAYNANNVGSLTIDGSDGKGGNYKISFTSSASLGRIAYYNLTMKNVDVESAAMNPFQWEGYTADTNSKISTALFENCNFVQNRNNDGCIFKVTGNGTGIAPANTLIKLTFKGCNIETSDGVVFLMHHGSNQEINLEDTDIVYKEKFTSNFGNSVFNIFHCANATINVDAKSTITAAGQAGGTNVNYIFNAHNMVGSSYHAGIQARTITVNLAEGATLKIDGDASRTDNKFLNGASKVTFNDNGANFVVGATVAANGVVLPTVSADKQILGYANGGKLYGTTVTAAGTYKAVKFDKATDLSVMQSAGLKTTGDAAGIAFGVTVSESVLELLGDSTTVGFYIVPESYKNMVDKGTLDPGDYIKLDATASELTDAGNGMKAAKLGIKGIPLENSKAAFVKLTAVGFITYTDADGNTTTIYTDNSYTTSLYDLATKSQNQNSDLVKRILALNA